MLRTAQTALGVTVLPALNLKAAEGMKSGPGTPASARPKTSSSSGWVAV